MRTENESLSSCEGVNRFARTYIATKKMPGNCRHLFLLRREVRPCALAAGEPELLAPPASDEFLLPQAAADFGYQRIFGGLSSDTQV